MRQAAGWPAAWLGVALAVGFPSAARAQAAAPGGSPNKPYKPVPLNLQREQLGGAELPALGRSRMRKGDCAGALEAFDAALRTLTDPTVYRDRGICHEQLGDNYPAIDDYRVYLTADPDAPDADGISARLRALEDKVAGPPHDAAPPPPPATPP